MPEPYYDEDGITIYHGDVLDVLDDFATPAFDGVVTDPPYCSGGRQQAAARNTISKSDRADADWLPTDTMGSDSYLWWLRQIGQRLMASAPMGTHFYCFTDWRQYPTVVTAMETVGWTLRSCVVWDKGNSGMGSFWRNSHEWVPVFAKGAPRPLPDGSFFNVLRATKPSGGEHPTVKPASVVSRLIQASGASTVLDPFMGSGTTLFAAKALGLRAVGVEVEERYCEIAAKRLAQGALDFGAA